MEQQVKDIYNECAKSFLTYLDNHNMSDYNMRQNKIIAKYNRTICREFCQDTLYAFAKVVNKIQESIG